MCHPFECDLCKGNFRTRFERNEHAKNHFKQKHCQMCDKSLIQIGDVWYVIRLHAEENCDLTESSKEFQFKEEIIKIESPQEDIAGRSYIECEPFVNVIVAEDTNIIVEFDGNKDFKTEFPDHNETVPIHSMEEKINNESHSETTELSEDTAAATSNQYVCEYCDKKFTSMSSLKRHLKNVRHAFECKLCTQVFNHREELILHANQVHEGKRYSCEFCGNTYKKRNSLNIHKSIHSSQNQVSCDICKKQFRHKEHLTRHIHRNHRKHEKLNCEYCGQAFSTAKLAQNHVQIVHEGKTLFKCKICEKSFLSNNGLKTHIDTHSESRRYTSICSICGQGFIRNQQMKEHLNTHTGDKPNVCQYCNKGNIGYVLLFQIWFLIPSHIFPIYIYI